MIITKTKYLTNSLKSLSLGNVGIYSVFDNSIEGSLGNIDYKIVSDDIKFPISFKSEGEENIKSWMEDFSVIAGPCSAESEEQVYETASFLSSLGIKYFRAGSYKPRTNAYSFQGLGVEGLRMCRKVCDEFDLKFVSEVKDVTNLEHVVEYADVIQIGSKCMYDVGVCSLLGKTSKDILLKRHFGATLKEFAQAADFIMCQGNESVMLCERGIRTFESDTRFSLDSCGIEWLKKNVRLKIVGDPSHAMGLSYGVEGLSLSLIAQKVDGLIIEVHPDPSIAKSDGPQQLNYNEFKNTLKKIMKMQKFVKKEMGA